MNSITLRGNSLLSKWGFEDGDIFADVIFDMGMEASQCAEDEHLFFSHEVLAIAVERYLLPELKAQVPDHPPIMRIGTIHNPIRMDGYEHVGHDPDPALLSKLSQVCVEVPVETVQEIAREVYASRGLDRA